MSFRILRRCETLSDGLRFSLRAGPWNASEKVRENLTIAPVLPAGWVVAAGAASMLDRSSEMPGRMEWMPPARRLLKVALGLCLLSFSTGALDTQLYNASGFSLVWLSNGFLLGVLLCSPRRQWPAFLVLGYVIDFSLNLSLANPLGMAAGFAVCNMFETVLAAWLMYATIAPAPDLTQVKQLRSFLINGVVIAPAATSLLSTILVHLEYGEAFVHSLRSWYAADLLGIATMTPIYLSFHYGKKFSPRSRFEVAGLFVLLTAVSLGVFRFTTFPMLWLVLLFLLLLGVRLGFTGAALGLLLVTFIGGYWTVRGYGPLSIHASLGGAVVNLQFFVAMAMLALYLTEVAMAGNRRIQVSLEASETRFRSLTEASRDVIVLAELDGRPKYVSPAVTELLGWEQQDLIGKSYEEIAHPDDLASVLQVFRDLLEGRESVPVAYQCLKRDGSYLWVEESTRLLRNERTGAPAGFVCVLRDISDRKAAEQQLKSAFQTVERLAMIDGLTGLANRRALDQTLSREWLSARRDRSSLSVLLIDVDHFKAFNDRYGHLAGDECLRRVATEIQAVFRRPLDLLARYGGEEFVAILPNTSRENAGLIAEVVRGVIEECCIPHEDSPHGVVTVSLGCATTIPSLDTTSSCLLKAADAALYQAKSNGRNRKEVALDAVLVN
jgi:diguanylate cyclase (GGDEF)-like protein/PAS domain S-box-containing protein